MKKRDREKSKYWEMSFASEEEFISISILKEFSSTVTTIHFSNSLNRVLEFLLDTNEIAFLIGLLRGAIQKAGEMKSPNGILNIGTINQQNQHFMFIRASPLQKAVFIGLAQRKGTDIDFSLSLDKCTTLTSLLEEANL